MMLQMDRETATYMLNSSLSACTYIPTEGALQETYIPAHNIEPVGYWNMASIAGRFPSRAFMRFSIVA